MHSIAWMIWLGVGVAALSLTRNPLYLLLLLLCLALVATVVAQGRRAGEGFGLAGGPWRTPGAPLQFAAVVVLFSAMLNALISRYGDTVLLRLPGQIPLLSGPITLEAFSFGMINGLALAGFFTAFTVVNLALPVHALIRFIPRAFFSVAVVVAIAVTFVPTTLRQALQIREAQAVRGHRVRGLRDGVALFVPLLVGGLERALLLAEAMTARGFAAPGAGPRLSVRLAVAGGLAAVLVGWLLRLLTGQAVVGGLLMAGGALAVGLALWFEGRRTPRTRYREERWSRSDSLVAAAAVVTLTALILPLPGIDRATLAYTPYPTLSLPPFDPLLGCALLGLLGPAWAERKQAPTK